MSTLAIVAVVLIFGSYCWLVVENKEKNKNSTQSNFVDLLSFLFVVLESLGNLNKTWLPLLTLFIGIVLFVISFFTEPHKDQTPASTTPPAASTSAPTTSTSATSTDTKTAPDH
jgi:Ca2+/Na+ antiporter